MKTNQKLKTLTLATLLLGLATSSAFAADSYAVDAAHGHVGFKIKHMVISKVKGHFKTFRGNLSIEEGKLSSLTGEIDVSSVDTANEKRDAHLKNEDFFNIIKHPHISFEASEIKDGVITGNLTILDKTKVVELPYTLSGPVVDPWGKTRVGIEASTTIDRREFGLTYSKAMEAGGLVIGNDVEIELNFEAIKQ